jgi:hypothetical protein
MFIALYSALSLVLCCIVVDASSLGVSSRSRIRRSLGLSLHTTRSLQSRASTLPTGWSLYKATGNDGSGCYNDGSTRILDTFLGNGYGLVSCLNACQAKNMAWAGIEYGGECYVRFHPKETVPELIPTVLIYHACTIYQCACFGLLDEMPRI